MIDLIKTILLEAEQEFPYAQRLRREFHQYPEIAREEYRTAERIEAELHGFGLTTRRVAETGVYAEIKGNGTGDKTILLRADIDALPVNEEHQCPYQSKIPGKMHACGHDAHTAALLTAAKLLSRHRDDFGGTVRLVFQPGEEIGYGARVFVDEGYADGADRCFSIHTASNVPVGKVVIMPGPNSASVDWFRISIKGKSAHVSTPEQGVDALFIAAGIVTGAQAISTRRFNPMEPIMIGIGILQAGSAYNVVAEKAVLEGTIRTMTQKTREAVKTELEQLAKGTAQLYGGSADIQWEDFTSPLVNDAAASAEVTRTAKELFGENNIITSRTPSLGGDDFAEFILRVPGVYANVGTANESIPETTVSHHNGHFDIDEQAIVIAAKLYAAYAVEFLQGI